MRSPRLICLAAAGLALVGSAQAGVVTLTTRAWPDRRIPFELEPGLSPADRALIAAAAAKWNKALAARGARIAFVPRTLRDRQRLVVLRVAGQGPNRCRASLGYSPDARIGAVYPGEAVVRPAAPMNGYVLLSGPCTARSVVHEFGHVLGLSHEHNRTDRDPWLAVSLLPPYREPRCDVAPLAEWAQMWCGAYRKTLDVGPPTEPQARHPDVVRNRQLLFTRQYDPCSVMQYVEDQTHARRHVALAFTSKSRAWARARGCPISGSGGGVISALDVATVRAFYEGG